MSRENVDFLLRHTQKKNRLSIFLKKYIYKHRESAFAAVSRVDKSTL